MSECNLPDIKRTEIDTETIRKFSTENEFTGLSVEILIEVGSYICVVGNIFPIETKSWSMNQAIVGGHLVRLYKFISAILDQTCQHRREISFVFMRLAFECIVNFRFLIKNASEDLFRSYRAYSLKHEYNLHKKIHNNISLRDGEVLEIEKRMLNSIESSFHTSKINMDDIQSSKLRNWGGKNIYEKARDIGLEEVYLAAFGGGSHSIHGNWQDMLEYHLEKQTNGFFKPDFEWHPPRPQMLNAIALCSTAAITEYLNWISPEVAEDLHKSIEDLQDRILKLDMLHEKFLSENTYNRNPIRALAADAKKPSPLKSDFRRKES